MKDTKSVGDFSELSAIYALARAGYLVSVPFGENRRYDLIIDKNNVLSRVQVKTGRLHSGSIVFNCFSSHLHRGGVACRRYTGEIEYFAVYCPEIDEVYLVPIEDLNVLKGHLRISPSRNRQVKGVRFASQYKVSREPNN